MVTKEKGDLQSLDRNLTNREIYDYFIKCKIVTDYPYFNVIRTRCLAVEFVSDLEGLEWELPQKKFANHLSILGNMVNTDSKRKKFGSAEIYNGSIIPTTQSFNRVPGSRWTSPPKGKGKAKGAGVQRYNRGANWTETIETSEENNLYSGQEGGEDLQPEEELGLEVMQARGNSEGESDLGWEGVGNYGTDSDVGNYVVNHGQTYDYGELDKAIDVEAYWAFGKEHMSRKYQGKSERAFNDFLTK